LAKNNGAIVTVKKGHLLFFKQGQNKTASRKPIYKVAITRSLGNRHHFSIADRAAYTGVIAHWLNTRSAKSEPVKVNRKREKTAKPKENKVTTWPAMMKTS